MRPWPSLLAASAVLTLALLLLTGGCVQYKAGISQQFMENGSARLVVRERMTMDQAITREYASTLQSDPQNPLGQRLMEGIVSYYNSGAYAQDLCQRAADLESCQVGKDGEIVWNASLPPDGRFHTVSTGTDWLHLRTITTYDIGRVPLIHYQAYSRRNPDEVAPLEWEGLRRYLQAYLDEAGKGASNDSGLREQMLGPGSPLKAAVAKYAPVSVSDQILDLEAGRIRGRLYGNRSDLLSANRYAIIMDYKAEFAQPILSASQGGEPVLVNDGRTAILRLDANEQPRTGRLVVITQKALSPLGAWTWAIPLLGILGTMAREFFLGSKRVWKEEEDEDD